MMGIKFARIPRRIDGDKVSLRILRLKDLPELLRLFLGSPALIPHSKGFPPANLWSFKQWLSRTFQVIYLIEQRVGGKFKIKGFVGLYDIDLGESLSLALGIFNSRDRGRGLGRDALHALLETLGKGVVASTVQAHISPSNLSSIRLFSRLQFDICRNSEDRLLMKRTIVPLRGDKT